MHALILLCINQHMKFEMPKLWLGHNFKNWSRDPDHAN